MVSMSLKVVIECSQNHGIIEGIVIEDSQNHGVIEGIFRITALLKVVMQNHGVIEGSH